MLLRTRQKGMGPSDVAVCVGLVIHALKEKLRQYVVLFTLASIAVFVRQCNVQANFP